MSFDASRFPFDPWKDFAGVVMQQGRVQLDSDWNEWLAILMRRIQAGTMDTVGRAVYPLTTPYGFKISTTQDASGRHVQIGAGRMYVDGLLAENHGPTPPTASTPWDPALAELSGAPQPPPAPSGAVLLDFTQQPYFPGAALPQGNGPFLIYLDVWQREVTYLERPDLIEKAVGIDTTGRWQTVWQVRFVDVSKVQGGVTCSTADSSIPPWDALTRASAARLTTGIAPSATPGPCCLTPNTAYTGQENQLYRVEIHKGRNVNDASTGSPPAATFKWSRDNASVATAVTAISAGTNSSGGAASVLTVDSTGKDHVLSFAPGDWIEITDDVREFSGQAGDLLQIDVKGVDQTSKTILVTGQVSTDIRTNLTTPPANYPHCHTRICRWDQKGKVFQSDGTTVWANLDAAGDILVPPAGTSLILENGVTVSFDRIPSNGAFTVGDYWTFAARTSDGSVEPLVKAPPMGVHHHYARLAVVTFPNPPTDCRIPWPPPFGTGHDTCACAVCVELADHQADPGAIAKAIDKVKAMGGGRVCLGPGVFVLGANPLVLANLVNVTLSGQGPATVLFYAGPGAAVTLQNCIAQRIEDLSIFAFSAAGTWTPAQAIAIGLMVHNCAGVTVSRCGIAAVGATVASATGTSSTVATPAPAPAPAASASLGAFNAPIAIRTEDAKVFTAAAGTIIPTVRSIAIALDGFVIEAAFRNNVLIADVGIGKFSLLQNLAGVAARGLLALAGCQIQDNLMLCKAAGVAIGDATLQLGICLHLLETAVDGNTVLGGQLAGIILEGLTDAGASIRISRNELEVNNIGIVTGLDAAVISDNVITQADVAAALRGGPAATGIGICVLGVMGFELPLFELRVLRNRIAAIAGAGIVLDARAVAMSVLDNAIQGTIGSGIAMGPHALVGDLIVRGNEVLIVTGPHAPGTTGVFGIAAGAAVNAIVADNTVGAIGTLGPIENATGIVLGAIATGTLAGNNVRDIGTTGGQGPFPSSSGIVALGVLDDLSVSGNVVHQASGPAPIGLFTGIAVNTDKAPNVTVSVQDNGVEGAGPEPLIFILGNADCVVEGNRCRRGGGVAGAARTAVVDVRAATVVAGDNRVDGPKDDTGLSIAVSRNDKQQRPAATVLGNVVTEQILLNGQALPAPWAPLNVIL